VFAKRVLEESVYQEWAARYQAAQSSMAERKERLQACAAEMEATLTLLGATGVEDLLQEGVGETIEALVRAKIRVWMITGDKLGTAVNIALSCGLMAVEDERVVLDGKSEVETKIQLEQAVFARDPAKRLSVVIAGPCLELCLSHYCEEEFLNLCRVVYSVVCCRVSPKVKGQVVALVRKHLQVVCLAIGDGSNDVAMLQEADVGVGIIGKEGRQAVMAADYATAQFRFLRILLLVHGRESYRRVVVLLAYAFYKGFSFALLAFWFSFYNLFSGQTLFESWHYGLYHVLFTSLPVLIFSMSDRDVSRETGLRFPELYNNGEGDLTWLSFLGWLAVGIYDSLVVFFVTIYVFAEGSISGLSNNGWCYGLFSSGICCMTSLVILVNAKLAMQVSWWTWPLMAAFLLSIAVWFGFAALLSVTSATGDDRSMYYVSLNVFAVPAFWFACILCIVLGLIPDFALMCYRVWHPRDLDLARIIDVTSKKREK
jgi:phospholipid-translocating ATPase